MCLNGSIEGDGVSCRYRPASDTRRHVNMNHLARPRIRSISFTYHDQAHAKVAVVEWTLLVIGPELSAVREAQPLKVLAQKVQAAGQGRASLRLSVCQCQEMDLPPPPPLLYHQHQRICHTKPALFFVPQTPL